MLTNTIDNFSSEVKQDAMLHFINCFPEEGCGVFTKDDRFVPFQNTAIGNLNSFAITDRYFNQLFINDNIACIVHSHNEYPHASKADLEYQAEIDIPFGIMNFRNGSPDMFVFFGDGIDTEPLIGRRFFFGVWDCRALVTDYIDQEFGKRLIVPPYEKDFWEKDEPVFESVVGASDFPVSFCDTGILEPYDLVFYKVYSKVINHVAIVMPTGHLLHHFNNKLSQRLPRTYYKQFVHCTGKLDKDWLK